MWATNVVGFLVNVLHVPVTIVGLVTTFLGGIIMVIPLVGLVFVLCLSLVWLAFVGVLLGTAWLWHRTPAWVHPLVAVVGIPVAVVGNVFLALSPGGGVPEDMLAKHTKQVLCQQWPYATTREGRPVLDVLQEEDGHTFFGAIFRLSSAVAERDSPYARWV